MAVFTEVGDGANTLFWNDRWLAGKKYPGISTKDFSIWSLKEE
jgi:hypothetical protein